MIQVEVDEDLCVGGGQCVMAAPEVFDQRDEDGVVILLEQRPSADQIDVVRRAELLCPAAAITVRATDG
jgi:ferredoxin